MIPRTAQQFSPGAAGPLLRLADDADYGPESWRRRALCQEVDPDLFYVEQGEPTGTAKAICRKCPVLGDCLEFALATDQRYGIWAATSEADRRKIRRERAKRQAAA